METKIIFEDENLLVLDKPAGMTVNKSDTTMKEATLQDWVEEYLKIPNPKPQISNKLQIKNNNYEEQSKMDFVNRAGIVHRLDKETSGIILVAKTLGVFINLQAQFKERKVQKTYLALAHGKIEPETGEINVAVGRLPWNRKRFGVLSGGRESVTQYKVLSVFSFQLSANGQSVSSSSVLADRKPANRNLKTENRKPKTEYLSLVLLSPQRRRPHHNRVSLQYIHHPIFADPLYAGRKTSRQDRKLLPRVFLHASKISLYHHKTEKQISLESPLPKQLGTFLDRLKP